MGHLCRGSHALAGLSGWAATVCPPPSHRCLGVRTVLGVDARRRCLWQQYAVLGRQCPGRRMRRGRDRRSAGRGLRLQCVFHHRHLVRDAGRGLDPSPCGQLWRRWHLLRGLCRRGLEPCLVWHGNGQRVDLRSFRDVGSGLRLALRRRGDRSGWRDGRRVQ